ncbi:MAG: argininosuccinate lyase [Bacteroidota bacterium]
MKLWDKNIETEKAVLSFTTGRDPEFDPLIAPWDILGSMAHSIMLAETGLIGKKEAKELVSALAGLYPRAVKGEYRLEEGMEDIHSQVEADLTAILGEAGKMVHTGRSRNDQVLLDMKLFLRDSIYRLSSQISLLFGTLMEQSDRYREILLPGYTHFQVAMPSSFGLWFASHAEALAEDLLLLKGVYDFADQNPLGSAAGYGSSFPIDREMTTRLLGFRAMHINSVNAQMARGRTELFTAFGLAAVAETLARLAMDSVLYLNQNFAFISFPEKLTTGSSIMPHKKNPDVLELIRGKANRIVHLPAQVSAVTGNLPSGYHRDLQLLKEIIFPAMTDIEDCLMMMDLMMKNIEVKKDILEDERYRYIYSVEEVNEKVIKGVPFRDAYKEVAQEIFSGRYRPGREHRYTHTGSIGNPGNEMIRMKMEEAMSRFSFIPGEKLFEELSTYFEK